jgi:hypothetical protein
MPKRRKGAALQKKQGGQKLAASQENDQWLATDLSGH